MRKPYAALTAIAIVALSGSTGVASAAGMKGADAAKPLRMTVGTLGQIGSLDPRHGNSVIAREVWNIQYPTLTALDPETLDPTAGLADAWRPLPDGRGWRYSLRENLTWSDGKPVTSADVVYSFDHARDQHWPYAGHMLDGLQARAVGSHSIEVTGRTHTAPGLLLHIVPAHVYSRAPELSSDTAALGVADGAWHVASTSSDSVTLDVLGRPAGPPLDQIVFRTYPSADALIGALAHRQVDVISGLPDHDIGRLEPMSGVTVNHAGDGTEYVLRFESFPNARMRQGVSLAIDRIGLVADTVEGVGTPAEIAARPQQATRDLLAVDRGIHRQPTIAIPTDTTSQRVGAFVRHALAAAGLPTRAIDVDPHAKAAVGAELAIERVPYPDKSADAVSLFQPDTLQAFQTHNVTGFLREPSQRSLIVFGPTAAQYAAITATQQPPGEQLSNAAYAAGAAFLLALCGFGYWIAVRARRRFAN